MPDFVLQFDEAEVPTIAGRYSYQDDEEVVRIGTTVRERGGALTVHELVEIVRWKTSGRQVPNALRNSSERVEEITNVALTVVDEELRIGALRCLHGVAWPVASAVLHLCHPDRYPILDYRALESLGIERKGEPNFTFWWSYVAYCRSLADEVGVDMRTLDRALWQWSSEQDGAT